MTVTGCLRVRNEARWIRRCVESILPVCDHILVFDDHSTDVTRDIVAQTVLAAGYNSLQLIVSPFEGLDEVRDKNYLLERALKSAPENHGAPPDWILMIDGDEAFAPGAVDQLAKDMLLATAVGRFRALAFPILYLWDREDQIRIDGVYRQMSRVSAFRPGRERFERTDAGGNFHCGNCPQQIKDRALVNCPLLHFGYMDKEDRIRKYRWYQEHDPANAAEDYYRHMVIGDLFPADSKFRHGGPLELRPLG